MPEELSREERDGEPKGVRQVKCTSKHGSLAGPNPKPHQEGKPGSPGEEAGSVPSGLLVSFGEKVIPLANGSARKEESHLWEPTV